MLTDLLTSSRGPGVIGTLLALIVLFGFGGLMVLVSDESKGSSIGTRIKQKEALIVSLSNKVEGWKEVAVTYKTNLVHRDQVERAEAKVKRRKLEIIDSRNTVQALKDKSEALKQKIEEYKKQYRIAERAFAIGEELGTLETKTGKVYERVKIKNVTALELRFSHKNGNTGVSYEILPDELQDRFQFSEKDATVMTKAEEVREVKSVQGGERYRVSKDILDCRMKINRQREKIVKFFVQNKRLAAEIISNESTIKTAKADAEIWRSRGNKGLNYANARGYEYKAARLSRRNSFAAQAISANTAVMRTSKDAIRKLEAEIKRLEGQLRELKR